MTLTRPTILIMAAATGISVANLYYNQPLLDQIRESFGISIRQVGWIPTLTQAGYATGMLFLVPLGDMLERKKLILFFTFLPSLITAWFALSQNFFSLAVASYVLGVASITPQLLIPFAAHLAPPEERGKVVGMMMSGLLIGILLARTIAGFVGASLGWRPMFCIASALLIGLMISLTWVLPKSKPTFQGNYFHLLNSVAAIFKSQPVLREASLFGAMAFGAFSAFWVTLIHLMQTPAFNLGSRAVGLFGLLGAGAAFITPWVGALTDKRDPRSTTGIMLGVTLFSFLIFMVSFNSLIGLAIGVLVMDVGVQSVHLCNQSRIFGLIAEARSRLQTAYMFCYFLGGAFGSWVATWAWSEFHWTGVCSSAIAMLLVAISLFAVKSPSRPIST